MRNSEHAQTSLAMVTINIITCVAMIITTVVGIMTIIEETQKND